MGNGRTQPISFDIVTTGLGATAVVTVVGLATDIGAWLGLNTTGRDADADSLGRAVEEKSGSTVRLTVCRDERDRLTALTEFAANLIDGDRHYVTAYHGETWREGFDLPFLRRACVRQEVVWPFPDVAYADVQSMVDRFDMGDVNDLEGVYEVLVGDDDCGPFDAQTAEGACRYMAQP